MAHGIRIDAESYLRVNHDGSTEVVDPAHVERYLSAASFFDGLVDVPETHTQTSNGTITVWQVTPDGEHRTTVFRPIA